MRKLTMMLLTLLSVMMYSCKDKDLYDADALKPGEEVKIANTFDFSTIQNVTLNVDYSAIKTYGPVFFSIYHENPFVGEGEDEHLNEAIKPIYEDYTDKNGRFNMNVELPAYAKHLYVVTGNFFVAEQLMEADVKNGMATAVAKAETEAPALTRAASHRGAQTQDITKMPQLSFIVDNKCASTGTRIYKDWATPLGTWDSASGAPSYLLDKSTVSSELVFSDEDMDGLYAAVGEALSANKPCHESYRNREDLTLDKASEVTITMLGGNTCWNSSLGYYYYKTGEEPTKPEDLNIIMLFPNTQDGHWSRIKTNQSYNGNIGVNRGDAIQLVYYPHIADGDFSEYTTVFPADMKIGFMLKSNGWGMQGKNYCIKGLNDGDRKYNVWCSSTTGASYCKVPDEYAGNLTPYQYPNPDGESRSAKFAYKTINGDKYAIVSFEDACNDQDYDDVIFALKPVNAFTPLPEIETKRIVTEGVYAFEDLWPAQGDYDMNDVVVDFKHERELSRTNKNEDFTTFQETFYLTTYQNYVTLTSGLALKLNTKVQPKSITMKKLASGSDEDETVTFEKDGKIYYLTNDVKGELGTTYILEVTYSDGIKSDQLASVQPFIFRKEADYQNWEVHIPFEAPTAKMNTSYFGTGDDASVIKDKIYFVRSGDYPFAFFLSGVNIEAFKNTILLRDNESKKINDLYPNFLQWSISKGIERPDWYLSPAIH